MLRSICNPSVGASLALVGLSLAACVTQDPASPTVMALPTQGENLALFQQHDTTCRQYASAQTGGRTPSQAAAKSGIGGAALGAGAGAAAGALLGSVSGRAGRGAAIGAGAGLLAGSLIGAKSSRRAAASAQHSYDVAYTQCMIANGEHIAQPSLRPVTYVPLSGAAYVPPPAYVMLPPPDAVSR
ncbi:MAG TPA: glycine zipper family protein [Bradyrhizobium sp.]|nr:glycine zipper family protein [Bradyrhizobium sp.]